MLQAACYIYAVLAVLLVHACFQSAANCLPSAPLHLLLRHNCEEEIEVVTDPYNVVQPMYMHFSACMCQAYCYVLCKLYS